MASDGIESTNRLLRVIIAVLIRTGENPMSLREQIETLSSVGLRPVEIAEILGKTSSYINKELSGLRKRAKGRK
jgi:DNA-binding CsgD family transcriptional regulator